MKWHKSSYIICGAELWPKSNALGNGNGNGNGNGIGNGNGNCKRAHIVYVRMRLRACGVYTLFLPLLLPLPRALDLGRSLEIPDHRQNFAGSLHSCGPNPPR